MHPLISSHSLYLNAYCLFMSQHASRPLAAQQAASLQSIIFLLHFGEADVRQRKGLIYYLFFQDPFDEYSPLLASFDSPLVSTIITFWTHLTPLLGDHAMLARDKAILVINRLLGTKGKPSKNWRAMRPSLGFARRSYGSRDNMPCCQLDISSHGP